MTQNRISSILFIVNVIFAYVHIHKPKYFGKTNEIPLINLLLNFIMKGYVKFLSA